MKFYIKTQPIRMSDTGTINLAGHIDKFFPECKYYPICKHDDQFTEFGYIEGSGDSLYNILTFCTKSFNVERLFDDEFIGALCLFFYDQKDMETDVVVKTCKDELDNLGIVYTLKDGDVDKVKYAKLYKISTFKTVCKKQFNDYNDLLANISKEMLLLGEYKTTLTTAQQTKYTTLITTFKSIYSVDTCLDALEEDINKMIEVMPGYYTAKVNVESKTTLDDVKSAIYK